MACAATGNGLFGDNSVVLSHAVTQMDQWMTAFLADDQQQSVRAASRRKAGDLVDACFTNNGTVKIAQLQVYPGRDNCNQLYPAFRHRA